MSVVRAWTEDLRKNVSRPSVEDFLFYHLLSLDVSLFCFALAVRSGVCGELLTLCTLLLSAVSWKSQRDFVLCFIKAGISFFEKK